MKKTLDLSRRFSTEAEAPALTPERGSVASQGLRSGAAAAGAGLSALAGTALESVGADSAARSMYDTSQGLRARSAALAPEISSYKQVDDVDSALKYGVGMLTQSAPALGAGLIGAVASRNPLVGATIASTPFTAGDIAVRQQEDPVIAEQSAGRRLGSALSTGLATAALSNAVPVAMGGKLLGQGVQPAMGLGRNIATNVGEGVLGNAAAGVAAEKITQNALTGMNAERDTSGDTDALLEAGVGGAVVGVPFAGAGIAGQAVRSKPAPRTDGSPIPNSESADKPALVDRVRNMFTKSEADADLSDAQRIAQNQDIVDANALRNAAPDQQEAMLRQADDSRLQRVQSWASKLYEDSTLAPEMRAQVDAFMANPTDRVQQAAVAGLHATREMGKKAAARAQSFFDDVVAKFDAPRAKDTAGVTLDGATASAKSFYDAMGTKFGDAVKGKKLSDVDSPKLHAAIADAVAPSLAQRFPELVQNETAMKSVTGAMRRVMAMMQADGKLDSDTIENLHGWFGDDTPSVLASLHSSVLDGGDAAATEKYFAAINGLVEHQGHVNSVEGVIRESLPEEMRASATPDSIREVVRNLREYMDGVGTENKPKAQVEFETSQIEAGLKQHFGKNYDRVMRVMTGDAARRAKRLREEQKTLLETPDEAPRDSDGFAETSEAGVTTEQEIGRQYYGGGKDKNAPEFVLSEAAHRRDYQNEASQAARIKRDVQAKNPDMNVRAISAHEYAQRHGIGKQQLMDMTNGKPDDYVMVVAEGMKREGLSWNDVDSVKLDTHKYSDSKSRIDTEAGVVLDARRVMNMFAPHTKMAFDANDAASPMHRLRRQFTEALGALSEHMGEVIEVPEFTVVARRNGKDITWGELQKLGRVKPEQADAKTSKLYADREAAMKLVRSAENADVRAAAEAEIRGIDRALDAEVVKYNDPDDVLPDAPNARPEALKLERNIREDYEARREIPELAKELGAARKVIEDAAKQFGPTKNEAREIRKQAGMLENEIEAMNTAEARSKVKDPDHAQRMDMLARRAEAMRAAADVIANSGRASLTMKERAAIHSYLETERKYDQAMKKIDRLRDSNFKRDKENRSMREAPLDRNVHEAAAEYGDALGDRFAASEKQDADGNPLHADNFSRPVLNGKLQQTTINAIDSAISVLENLRTDAGGKNKIAWTTGQKARELLGKIDAMKAVDQALLASIVKDVTARRLKPVLEVVTELHAKYGKVEAPAKKPDAFTERVLGEGDLAPVLKAIRASDDALAVRRAIDALAGRTEPRAREVLDTANERMTALVERNPDIAYSLQRISTTHTSATDAQRAAAAYINKVLGGTVDAEFKRMLHAGSFETIKGRVAQGLNEDVIRISVHALDPMSVAFHESMHAFVSKLRAEGLMNEAHPLMKAADSALVRNRLRELLDGEPDALRQIERSLEERVAYMYQFWAAGQLTLAPKPAGVFGQIAAMIRNVMGLWSNDQRALSIMEYFHSGEYAKNMGDRSAVARALMRGTDPRIESLKEMARPLSRLGDAMLATGNGRLRDFAVPALTELADAVYAPLQGDATDPGYVPAARMKYATVMNDLAGSLADYSPAQITDALESMQRRQPGATPEERLVIRKVRKTLDEMFDYMQAAGVKVGDLGYGKDYFPRVWDADYITSHEAEFRAMLQQYKDGGKFGGSIDQVIAAITRADGSELQVETVKPGMLHTKERILSFIRAEDAAPFLQKDMYRVLNSYVMQATRRAEWARRFKDDGSGLADLLDRAKKEGATSEQVQFASDYLQGVDGTLGDHIDPKLRRAFGNMIVYQNIRLLPLAIFSSVIDPMGVMVRGGTVADAFRTFKRGMSEIPKGFKKGAKDDEWTQLAGQLGVIDSAALRHAIGSSFSQGMTGDTGRKINDVFFKYNLMEQFNTSMRVGATQAASGFLARHADGTASAHSKRWLAELGLRPGDVVVKDGAPLLTVAQFKANGLSDADAQAAADRMTIAVNRWVDGAVLRPNAAHKPVWMNDPHFALIAHLKQFVYSFQETILKRVVNEARFGNVGPAYALAAYIPFMLAADLMKGVVVGGGSQPDYKEGWEAGDYLAHATQRAGVFGVGQMGIDVVKDVNRGGLGIGALSGPTIEQLADAASVVGGSQQFQTFALNALPANALLDAAGEAVSTNAEN